MRNKKETLHLNYNLKSNIMLLLTNGVYIKILFYNKTNATQKFYLKKDNRAKCCQIILRSQFFIIIIVTIRKIK